MNHFTPDYMNLQKAACNIECQRFPLYEHIVKPGIAETILGRKFDSLFHGDYADKKEYFRCFCEFFQKMGYDTRMNFYNKNGLPLPLEGQPCIV